MSSASVDNLVVGYINLKPVHAVRRTGSLFIYFPISIYVSLLQDSDILENYKSLTSCLRSLERAMIGRREKKRGTIGR